MLRAVFYETMETCGFCKFFENCEGWGVDSDDNPVKHECEDFSPSDRKDIRDIQEVEVGYTRSGRFNRKTRKFFDEIVRLVGKATNTTVKICELPPYRPQ